MVKLLIVDLQRQFNDNNGSYQFILDNIESLKNNYDSVYATVFSQSDRNKNYIDKLGWCGCVDCNESDLEFDTEGVSIIIKDGYGVPNITDYFSKDDEIHIIGCDSDACVMAICFQLWDLGYNFRVLSNFIYTSASKFTDKDVLKIMKRNFGSCVC